MIRMILNELNELIDMIPDMIDSGRSDGSDDS